LKINLINNIVILGGGTSAWLSAAYLKNVLPKYNITVIDKEIGTPIGVGEGTLLKFESFLNTCGFPTDEWFSQVDATYKTGILFPGWVHKDNTIWHPFVSSAETGLPNVLLQDLWSRNQEYDFKKFGINMYELTVDDHKIHLNTQGGFHIDCSKLVNFIKKKLVNKVQLIQSEMISINRKTDNSVESLVLKNGQIISGDLFIDCSGLAGLLNNSPVRNDLTGRLICDTAIAGHIPYQDINLERRPYVVSEAVECGWVWQIPVKNRIGSGLVFNRSITSIDDAKDYFVKYWNSRINRDSLKVIDWTPFYNNNIWHENVVSIGLSAGFIEPLESTGIALITEGIYQLVQLISNGTFQEDTINSYNIVMKSFFEEAIDFVSSHYAYTERKEPFWQIVKNTIKISPRLQHHLNLLSDPTIPLPRGGNLPSFFTNSNWNLWLIQMGFKVAPRELDNNNQYALEAMMHVYDFEERRRQATAVDHNTYLNYRYSIAEKYHESN
jgi:tryptophan halogenase